MVTEKTCAKCKKVKPANEFSPNGGTRLRSHCKPCHAAANRGKCRRAHNLHIRYNLTIDQYDAMLASQGGVCAICGSKGGKRHMSVDHDHYCCPGRNSCGKCVRGILCQNCNLYLLGRICKETAKGKDHALEILRKAGDYLRKATETADS